MSHSTSTSSLTQRINYVNQQALDHHKIVGSVVMVAKNRQIIFQQASGYAQREQKKEMDIDSLFLLSSVSKPIVIAAALLLIEKGILDLEAKVTDFLPHFRPELSDGSQPEITLHQLLTHTAGLGYRFNEPYGKGTYNELQISDGFDEIYISLQENLQRLTKAPLLYEPGTNWVYSLAIDVLGGVMMAATNQSLDDIIKTYISAPLEMHSTGFSVLDKSRLVTHYYNASPYPLPMPDTYQMQLSEDWNNGILYYAPKRIFEPSAYHSGGAGMVGSAPDFMRFLLAITAPKNELSMNRIIDTMAKCHVGSEMQTMGPGWGYGYGGAVLDNPEIAQTPHGKGTILWGGVYGHTWFYDPIADLAGVIFTNTAIEGMSGQYPVDICNAIYGV